MIDVHCQDFSGDYDDVNGDEPLETPKLGLCLALITVGKPGLSGVLQGSLHRIYEVVSLLAAVCAYLDFSQPPLRVTELFRQLDPSEKTGVCYRFGMAFALLVTRGSLGVTHLRHLDPLIQSGAAVLTPETEERPDLVGHDGTGGWHVVEAKGRSSYPTSKDRMKAKNQAEKVVEVHGAAPETTCSCLTNIGRTPIKVDLRDPDPLRSKHSIVIDIDAEKFYQTYYQIISDLKETGSTFRRVVPRGFQADPVYMVTDLPGLGFEIGVERGIYRGLHNRDAESLAKYIPRRAARLASYASSLPDPESQYLAPDGFLISVKAT